jgi:hypothetical protein
VEGNLALALAEEARPGAARKLTGREEARLVATACSKPPAGRARWTPDVLASEMVKLTEHADLSRETVRRRLAEKELRPWQKQMWCIPTWTAPMLPAWRMCSIYTLKTPIRVIPSCVSMKARRG